MKELIDNIKNILDKYAPFLEKQYDGTYKGKLYVDYTDELDKKTIIEILNSKHPLNAFYDTMSDCYIDDIYEYDSVFKLIEENWNLDEFPIDFIMDWVYENVWFEIPYSHYLNKIVNVDIIVDTGDGNYDFTLNNFASYNAAMNEQIHKNSSILWLVKQQGYSKKQLYDAIRHHHFINSAFLESVYEELINVTSHMNALAFFVKMTLDDVINYLESPKDIVISEDASCGLYDCWNGAGSLLEIVLEKPVVIPKEYVQMNIDGGQGYGIDEIYGLCDNFWNGTVNYPLRSEIMENMLKLETPYGEIKAKIIEEPNYPAINIYINDELAVIVEYNAIKNCFSIYTYDNNSDEPLQNITWDI